RDSTRLREYDFSDLRLFTDWSGYQRHADLQYGRMDGRLRMVAFERRPQYGMVVAVGRSEREILAGSRRIVQASMAAFVGVGTLLLVAVGTILRSWRAAVALLIELRTKEERLSEVQQIGELGLWEYDTVTDRLLWS